MAVKKDNPSSNMVMYLVIGAGAFAVYYYVTKYGPGGAVTDANGNVIPGAVSYWDTWFGSSATAATAVNAPASTQTQAPAPAPVTTPAAPPATVYTGVPVTDQPNTFQVSPTQTYTVNPYQPGTGDWAVWEGQHNGGVTTIPSASVASQTIQTVLKDYAFWQQMTAALAAKNFSDSDQQSFISTTQTMLNALSSAPPQDTTDYASASTLEAKLLSNIAGLPSRPAVITNSDPQARTELMGITPVTSNRAGIGGGMGMSFGGNWEPKNKWRN